MSTQFLKLGNQLYITVPQEEADFIRSGRPWWESPSVTHARVIGSLEAMAERGEYQDCIRALAWVVQQQAKDIATLEACTEGLVNAEMERVKAL